MKICKKCHLTYGDDKKFCIKCGAPLSADMNIAPQDAAKKTVYEDRLKAEPLNSSLLYEFAQFLFNTQLFQDAISVALKILAINENSNDAKVLLFQSYININKSKEAIEIGELLLKQKPNDIPIDEQTFAKITFYILTNKLNSIKPFQKARSLIDKFINPSYLSNISDNRQSIEELTNKYLTNNSSFFKDKNNSIIAECWYAITMKYKECNLLLEAIDTCKKTINTHNEEKYHVTLNELEVLLYKSN